MIYLALDTNIWIYLANGYDTSSEKFHDNHHFSLLNNLIELSDNNDICVLINDIIIEEWKRNKTNTEKKVSVLDKKMKNLASFNEIAKYVKSPLDKLKQEYIEGITNEIKANQDHLKMLETFLYTKCQRVPLTEQVKLRVFDLSIKKKAPFHNQKNNTADAAILFSIPEFFKDPPLSFGDAIMFISNNFSEYTDGRNLEDFHSDILECLEGFKIQYHTRLPSALKLSAEIIAEIDAYNEDQISNILHHQCLMSFCEFEDVFLDNTLVVKYQTDEEFNPNQLSLFPEIIREVKYKTVEAGGCPQCEVIHFECPECNDITCANDAPDFYCTNCRQRLELIINTNEKPYLYVYDEDDYNNYLENDD